MKLESAFKNLLENTVNLNKSRFEVAELGIETMTNILKNNKLFGDKFIDIIPQGSFRQETIIKPTDPEKDFDVDILFEMKIVDGWSPSDYLAKLADQFKGMDRYRDKVDTRGKTRCVTIDYESDFHIDIIPAISTDTEYVIMNKKTNKFELTDGDGYANWFEEKNNITGNKNLIKVVRLIKYIRDSKEEFEVKSILLTTLLGNQIFSTDDKEKIYRDVATSFVTILGRLDAFLQANPLMPVVTNPVLSTEIFNRHWDQVKYDNFRDTIHDYSIMASDAYLDTDEVSSLQKWQKIFGEEFIIPLTEKSIQNLIVPVVGLGNYSHCQLPLWQQAQSTCTVKIKCFAKNDRNRDMGELLSDSRSIGDNWVLKYMADVRNMPSTAEIYWQVVNTGNHAFNEGGLRGSFFKGKDLGNIETTDQKVNWEGTKYLGKHWIECFVVDSNLLIARSGRFYINVKPKGVAYWRKKYRK